MRRFLTVYMTVNWHREFAMNLATFLKYAVIFSLLHRDFRLALIILYLFGKKKPCCHKGNYGTFVPTYFRSRERKFHRWNFHSLELSLPGTFVQWNFRSHSQRNVVLLPNTNYDYLVDKLMEIKAL